MSLDGKILKWDDFKKEILKKDNFSFDGDVIIAERDKSVRIWNYIGQLMCKIHGIKFKKAENLNNSGPLVNTLYILLLDESGSMRGRWETLLAAAGSFASLVN